MKRVRKSKLANLSLKRSLKNREKTIKKQKEKIKNPKKTEHLSLFKKILLSSFILIFFLVGAFLIWASQLKIPDIHELEDLKMSQATKIYDRTGKVVLYNIYQDEKRTIIPLSKISKYLQYASVAIEDKNFYEHDGTELYHLFGAVADKILHGKRLRGGSTITQQVVKQTILTRERTMARKVKEWILSWRLEDLKEKELGSKRKAKDAILEIYLNENPYGGTIYGVEEASLFYFGKHASDVSIAEAAYLAAMPQAPTTYSPYGKHRALLDRRKNAVLYAMLNQGYIDINEYKTAKKEKVNFVFQKKNSGIRAPHFVMYIKKKLESMFDPETLKMGGLKVYTTLNYELQNKIQEIVKKNIDEAEKKKLKVSNGAVVVINSETGEILAMVGSKDYFAKDIDGKFNVATAPRQPGSTFKPFAYLTAFQKGYTPKTVIWDVKTEFSDACGPNFVDANGSSKNCYHPYDYDRKFKGHMLMEQALPESRNIPAIKTLYLAGLQDTFKNIKLMGIRSLNKPVSYYGMPLVLGAGEVQLLNLVSAYSVLSNEGKRNEPNGILRIENSDGKDIYEMKIEPEQVISKRIALIMSRILSDNTLKYPTFGYNSPLYFHDREVASKTGTTNDDKDFWVIGYDPKHISLGAWVGNNDNKPGKGRANYYCKKIWRESMEEALKNIPKSKFERVDEDYSDKKPVLRGVWEGNAVVKVDTQTGGLATDETPEEFIKEIPLPSYHSILHWVDPKNPNGPVPEVKDRAYERWESGVQNWVIEHNEELIQNLNENIQELLTIKTEEGETLGGDFNEEKNNEEVDESDEPNFIILSPGDMDTYTEDESIYLNLKARPNSSIQKYEVYINDKFFGTTTKKVNIPLKNINGLKKTNILKVVSIDSYGRKRESDVLFQLK